MRIAAVTMAVPQRVQTAEELAPLIDRSAEWIQLHSGVHRRHIADDSVSPAELAAEAARQAISVAGKPDLILYAGALTQQLVPDTSAFVHKELGFEQIPCFTINQTCLSFVAALQVADGLLKAGSYKKILICSGELGTRGRSFGEAESASLLGDGAAAAIVEYDAESKSSMVDCSLETWSSGIDLCSVRAGNHPPPRPGMSHDSLFCFHMQGPQLYRFVRPRLKRFLKSFLDRAGYRVDQVQLVVPHQASGPGLRILEQIGFSNERIVNIVADYGNCVAASIPMALAIAARQDRIASGDLVLLVGTSAGVSLGAALIRW